MLPRVYLYTPPIFNFVKSTVIGTLKITRLFTLKSNHVKLEKKKHNPHVQSNKIKLGVYFLLMIVDLFRWPYLFMYPHHEKIVYDVLILCFIHQLNEL